MTKIVKPSDKLRLIADIQFSLQQTTKSEEYKFIFQDYGIENELTESPSEKDIKELLKTVSDEKLLEIARSLNLYTSDIELEDTKISYITKKIFRQWIAGRLLTDIQDYSKSLKAAEEIIGFAEEHELLDESIL